MTDAVEQIYRDVLDDVPGEWWIVEALTCGSEELEESIVQAVVCEVGG